MKHNNNPVFPEGFLWGASSAAWQVEGATLEDGRTQAIIDLNSQTKKPFADNSIASDHYHHYKEDVALMKECGFTSYRFGISWSRVIPGPDRKVNPKGIEFYNNLINELKAAGIEPIVTIYHYDMPCWVDEKYGGWHNRAIIDEFDYYCRVLFENFGDRVKYWLSINEQNMQIVYGKWLGVAKGCTDWEKEKWQINHIMNMCHAKAVIACHEMVEGGKIGPVPGYVPIYPKSCKPEDQIAAMNAEELTEKVWNDTYAYRNYSLFIQNYWKEHDIDPKIEPGDMELLERERVVKGPHELIPGSGVNLDRYSVLDYPGGDEIHFVFIARIVKQKGIEQYLDMVHAIRAKYPNTVFHICGNCTPAYEDRIKKEVEEGNVIYHGRIPDVTVVHKISSCTVLPSFYPEGMNNVLLESCSLGRPIITTDRPGCGEIVDDGVNGFVVKQRDSQDLIDKVERFLSLSWEERKAMGLAGRAKVEKEFSRQIVVKKYLEEIG